MRCEVIETSWVEVVCEVRGVLLEGVRCKMVYDDK